MPPRRAVALLAVAASLALGGCGFTPLYATPGLTQSLAAVDVRTSDTQTGYLVREALDDHFGHVPGVTPVYRLQTNVSQRRRRQSLTVDDYAQRYILTVSIRYNLVSVATGRSVRRGSASAEVTYNSADQPYAAIVGYEDALAVASTEAARKVHLQLAAYLASNAS